MLLQSLLFTSVLWHIAYGAKTSQAHETEFSMVLRKIVDFQFIYHFYCEFESDLFQAIDMLQLKPKVLMN